MKTTLSVLFALCSVPALAAEMRNVSVSGTCKHNVIPDRASLVLTAEAQDTDLQKASRKATEIYERVRRGVQNMGLENLELKTSEYQVFQVREWVKDRQVSRGFRARMGLIVTSASTQKMGNVIELAAREGVQDVGQLTLELSDAKLLLEQQGCLQEAVSNAKAKALKLVEAAGARLGPVQTLSESWGSVPMPPMYESSSRSMKMATMAAEAPRIETGNQVLSVTVQATFGIN